MSTKVDLHDVENLLRQNVDLIQQLQIENAELQDKADFYDAVTETEDTRDFAEVAKILNIKGIGRNNLIAILREHQILRQNNEPYQAYVDRGYFKVVEVEKTDYKGRVNVYSKTVMYQKGIDYIRRLLLERDD